MSSLQEKYWGAQDAYFIPKGLHPKTFESEYVESVKITVEWKKFVDSVPKVTRDHYEQVCGKFEENPAEYAEEYVDMKRRFQEEGLWDLLLEKQKSRRGDNEVIVKLNPEPQHPNNGITGLRFVGDPSSIESICFEIGGQRFDTIYPSITGQFDPIHMFDTVIPNTNFHHQQFRVKFLRESVPLHIFYDRVHIKSVCPNYEAFYASTQYNGSENVKKGKDCITLNFNHPVETIRLLSKVSLTNAVLVLDGQHRLHIPYKGVNQNGLHLYEIRFNRLINFSRIEKATVHFDAVDHTTVYPFAKTWNVGRFMNGMAGMAFSK